MPTLSNTESDLNRTQTCRDCAAVFDDFLSVCPVCFADAETYEEWLVAQYEREADARALMREDALTRDWQDQTTAPAATAQPAAA